ncbi:hypothetical protein P9738_09270, partial [Bacillus siamensis]|nr:hypothetical protein [Bacillus siamensis]
GAWLAPESGCPRSFDEPQRFHGAALLVQTRWLRKRGAFSPSDALLPVPIGTDGRGFSFLYRKA